MEKEACFMKNDQSNCQVPVCTTIQRMSDGKMLTSALDLPQEEFEKLIQQYSNGLYSEQKYIPFTQEDAVNLARNNEELIAKCCVKTEGFEKAVVFLMSLMEQIWQVSNKYKRFRMELSYDAESLNTNYVFFAPTDQSESDGKCQEASKKQD